MTTEDWPGHALLRAADASFARRDFDGATRFQTLAWQHADTMQQQAATLQCIGSRIDAWGDVNSAAGFLQVALTLWNRAGCPAEDEIRREIAAKTLQKTQHHLALDAVILSGGSARRLGGASKPDILMGGWPLLDHVLVAAASANQVVVGPPRETLTAPTFVREEPIGAGPVAAIAAAAAHLQQPRVLLLAADLPFIGPLLGQVQPILRDDRRDAIALVDTTGQTNFLAAVWWTHSLLARLDAIGDPTNVPVRALYERVDVLHWPDFDALGMDCDTHEELAIAEQRFTDQNQALREITPLAWLSQPVSG